MHTPTHGQAPRPVYSDSTGICGSQLILGDGSENRHHPKSYKYFVTEWEERMKEAYQVASENIKKVKESLEERWRKRITASTLKPNDKVLVKNVREQDGPGNLRAHWETR